MSSIQIKLTENLFTPAQKSQIITELTEAMASIERENMHPVTPVAIEEVRSAECDSVGQPPATDAVQARFASFLGYGYVCF